MAVDEQYIDPEREQFELFKSLPRDTPILMLNMLRYKDIATYPEGHPLHDQGLSGAEAYKEYMRTSGPVFAGVGGEMTPLGSYQCTVIGPVDERWDNLFIARYPNANAFLAMITDPDYQRAVVNRQAAIATSRLIRLSE